MTAALCIGAVGGAAHLRMSMAIVSGMDVARFMGLGSAAAVILQYLLQIRWGVTPVLPFFMLVAFILFLFLLRRTAPQVVTEGEGKVELVPSRRICFSVLIASTFILFACYYNESIHHLMIRSDYASANVYSWPRLMMVPVYLLHAVIGDRKKGKLVPVVSLCIMLIALLNVVLIGNAGSYWLNMCFFYIVIAAYTAYYLLTFWRLAPGTRHPALWAPFGRMLDSGMVLLTGAVNFSAFSAFVVLGVDIVGAAVVILLMAINGDLDLAKTQTAPELVPAEPERVSPESEITPGKSEMPPSESEITPAKSEMPPSEAEITLPEPEMPPSAPLIASPAPKIAQTAQKAQTALSPEEALKRMRERYDLTRREAEVLRELVCTEDKQTAISERLEIQVRTLQDYVTRLYRKTGTSTRAGLTDLYHKTMNK